MEIGCEESERTANPVQKTAYWRVIRGIPGDGVLATRCIITAARSGGEVLINNLGKNMMATKVAGYGNRSRRRGIY